MKIFPGVFSPKGTRTTEIFLEYLLPFNWEGKKLLELGAGSGIISFQLAQKGAEVTASDIFDNAILGLEENRKRLDFEINIVRSDLFEKLPEKFDLIIINPPFFNKNPKNESERAWYCGEEFEFFVDLFEQFSKREFGESIWMVLSENANVEKIMSLAEEAGIKIDEKVDLPNPKESHSLLKLKTKLMKVKE